MSKIIWGYIYTQTIEIHIKDKTWKILIFTLILETFAKLDD